VVITHDGSELAHAVHVVAAFIGAYVVVIAHDIFAEIFSAEARYTDAGR
jgi:hypothetical protein